MSLYLLLSHMSCTFSSLFSILLNIRQMPRITGIKLGEILWNLCFVLSFFCLIRLPASLRRSTLIYLAGFVWFCREKKKKIIFDPNWIGFRIPNCGPNLYHFYRLKQWTVISLKHRKKRLLHLAYMIYPLIIAKYLLINIQYKTNRTGDGGWWRIQPYIMHFKRNYQTVLKFNCRKQI